MPKAKGKTAACSRTRTRRALPTPRLSEDVISFSECRNNLAACLKRVRETHRPIFITQNGRRPTSFIGNIEDWDSFVETMELMEDVRAAEAELDRGEVIPFTGVYRVGSESSNASPRSPSPSVQRGLAPGKLAKRTARALSSRPPA